MEKLDRYENIGDSLISANIRGDTGGLDTVLP